MSEEKMCACGKPLHYSDPKNEQMVQRFVNELGENERVSVGGRTWMVPRHYIALHGIAARELPTLGFEEVTDSKSPGKGDAENG